MDVVCPIRLFRTLFHIVRVWNLIAGAALQCNFHRILQCCLGDAQPHYD